MSAFEPEVEAPRHGWAPLRAVRAAFTFLTRIPVGGFPYHADDWRWSSAHFPLVGAVLGCGLGAACATLLALGPLPAAALVLAMSLLVTGAFHEDGLADTADALGGAYDRARVLEILKDSRIGAFGGAALVIALLARCALLAALGPLAPAALVASECASRLPPVVLMALLPYATTDARSRSRQITRAGPAQALVAGGWTALVLIGLVWLDRLPAIAGVAVVIAAVAAGLECGRRFMRRLGGVTGDFLGATQQVAAIAMLIAIRAVTL